MSEVWVWAQTADTTTTALIQYGAVGLLAILALGAVRVLFQREVQAHDAAQKRADRLEEELRQHNATVQERYLTTLAEATRVMSDVLETVRSRDERRP